MEMFVFIMQSTIIYAMPLLIVALAGVFAERSGVINLALEGQMIFGAFIGAIFVTGVENTGLGAHPQLMFLLALIIAGISGAIFSLLLSYSAVTLKADQTIGGTALNMLAPGIVCAVGLAFFNSEKIHGPFRGYAILNPEAPAIFRIFIDKMYISTYIIVLLFVVLSLWLYYTKTGTHLRACGENPQAAASVGINVYKMRYLGTTISGFLAGLGGYAYVATVMGGTAESNIGGMGFLALAIMIFGNWKPLGIVLGAFMFGFLKCIGAVSSSLTFLPQSLPMYFYNIIPYLAVLIVLAISSKKSGAPKAEGIPYDIGLR